jgi:hypothetical protein
MLEATFQVKGTVGLVDLQRQFFSHCMTNGEDIEEHIQCMCGWFQQINTISKDLCSEVDGIMTLITSLPDSWDMFTQSVNFQFKFDDTNKQVNQIADLRLRILAKAHRQSTQSTDGKAFFSTNKPNVNRLICANGKSPDKSKTKCNNCGRPGHWAAKCRSPGGGAFKSGNNRIGQNRRINSPNKTQFNNARTHIAIDKGKTITDYAFSTFKNSYGVISKPNNAWIADSGKTAHIANNRNIFSNYYKSPSYVTGVTGKEPIVGRGTIELLRLVNNETQKYEIVKLTNGAHVPSSLASLISLSLVTDKGFQVSMDQD